MSAPMLVAGSISLATSFLGSLISIVLHGRVLWASSKQLSFSMVAYAFGASALMQIVGKGLPEADERVCAEPTALQRVKGHGTRHTTCLTPCGIQPASNRGW
jgi:hypothetical protein